jgi:hypothetical protein
MSARNASQPFSSSQRNPGLGKSPLYSNSGMPCRDRNRYSNKESVKVNTGLHVLSDGFQPHLPAIDMTLSLLSISPEPEPTTEQLIQRLLEPPSHAFPHGTLSIQWVFGLVGMRHFVFRDEDERYVLAAYSELRQRGRDLGLPAVYLEWLCGVDGGTASEQSVCLTPGFFM